jgi:hypothetical protein
MLYDILSECADRIETLETVAAPLYPGVVRRPFALLASPGAQPSCAFHSPETVAVVTLPIYQPLFDFERCFSIH